MNRVPDLHGEHLRLRELRAADQPVHERIVTSRSLTRYLGTDRMDIAQAHDAFAAVLAQPLAHVRRKYTLAVCTPYDDTMLGTAGLLIEDYGSNAMLTTVVLLPGSALAGHAHETGRLLMAYGFGSLGLHRIWAGHRTDHDHMPPIMRAAGLTSEAILRQLFHTRGCWHDVTTYAALAPDWKRQATPAELAILDVPASAG